jgi:NAD(P)-dependent dehydrogenase (short-subunit alcohol dehydrogenase family)
VTGGGSGIGRCTAHELASLGATVVVIGHKEAKLDEIVAEMTAAFMAARLWDDGIIDPTRARFYLFACHCRRSRRAYLISKHIWNCPTVKFDIFA